MIQFDNVTKRLGNFTLENISFDFPRGYICGLVGQNGAGKTSLLHMILGLYRPNEGTIKVLGKEYEENEKRIHDEIGTVLAEDLFETSLTLEANGEKYGKYYSKYQKEKYEQYLEKFQLEKKSKFGKLSKGEKLKCQFAFALSHEPQLLILDEPTGNFDPNFREQFWKILGEFMQDETHGVILATHLTEDLDRIGDYLIYLEKGKQVFAGDMESFRESYRMVHGKAEVIRMFLKDAIIYVDESDVSTKALVRHSEKNRYVESFQVTYPSVEEFMYCYTKRGL